MGKLIEGDGLKNVLLAKSDVLRVGCPGNTYALFLMKVALMIDAMPAVDAVPVIRCKDCKNYSQTLTGPFGFGSCKYCIYPTPDDFCSHGERRKENE